MDCRPAVLESCNGGPGPSSPKIMGPGNFSPVSGMSLDGLEGLLGCLIGCGVNHGMVMGWHSTSSIPSRDEIWDAKNAKSQAVFHGVIAKPRFLSIL